ncbi:MAG TPA: tetratricopeptide repeat protein, partial [Terriglobia bacterium]|nr:tetratricopeptide repeat protein [Terriglobia bacterium]
LGKAYVRLGQPDRAIVYLKRAVADEPDSANFHYQLGQAYLKAGNRAEAQKELAEAGKLQAEVRAQQAEKISGMASGPEVHGKLPAPQGPATNPQ